MPRTKSTVAIPADPTRLGNPIEKWRKDNGQTAPQMAAMLGYSSVDGYHKLVRCEAIPLGRLSAFCERSGVPLDEVVSYFRKHARRAA